MCALLKNWNLIFKYLLNCARYKKIQTHSNSRGCALLALGKLKDKQFKNVHCQRAIAKISGGLTPMKSDYYVVNFLQKSEQVYFSGPERVRYSNC